MECIYIQQLMRDWRCFAIQKCTRKIIFDRVFSPFFLLISTPLNGITSGFLITRADLMLTLKEGKAAKWLYAKNPNKKGTRKNQVPFI